MAKWVTNTTQPSLETLIAIANALEVPVQVFPRKHLLIIIIRMRARTICSATV